MTPSSSSEAAMAVVMADIWDEAVVVIITDGAEAADITMVDAGNPQYRAQEEALS
jgi:hypothetical protein